jgi:hypothetical protein
MNCLLFGVEKIMLLVVTPWHGANRHRLIIGLQDIGSDVKNMG